VWTSRTSRPALSRVKPSGPKADRVLRCSISAITFSWFINWESWLVVKNSLILACSGLWFIIWIGKVVPVSIVDMWFWIFLLIWDIPVRNFFCSISPTYLTRRCPKWSISSAWASGLLFRATIFSIIVTKSSAEIVLLSNSASSIFLSNLLLKRNLPTGEISYLSAENKELINSFAPSGVARSPSRKRLYISIKESSASLDKSFSKVFLMASSAWSLPLKAFMISASFSKPKTLKNEVTANFLFLSILT